MGATYTLDWSEASVGPTIDYTGANGLVTIDDSIPAGVGATKSLMWVPRQAGVDNVFFEMPVNLDAAGTVSFYRRTSSEAGWDPLIFYIDGVEQARWSGETAWGQASYAVPTGAHTLKWAFTHDASTYAGSNTAWLAKLVVTNMITVPPITNSPKTAAVYDFENGAVPAVVTSSTWTNSTSGPITGTRSMRTPATTADNTSYNLDISLGSLSENGVIAFDLKRDAEASFDVARVLLGTLEIWKSPNGVQTETKNFRLIFKPGALPLTVRYTKDGSAAVGADAVWIDNLRVPFINSSTGVILSPYLSGAGTLTTAWTHYVNRTAALSGDGTLSTHWTGYRKINSALSGTGTLSTTVVPDFVSINSALSGTGTLSTQWFNYRRINSAFSGAGTLTSVIRTRVGISSAFSGMGYLSTALKYSRKLTSALSGEGVLVTELGYVVVPTALGATPLGKLVSFSVSTSAVPINPAEGSGATPSVSAGYIKGLNTEFALGESNVLTHGSVGTYEGEIVRLGLPEGSDVASISQDTALTLLNTELQLFPFIDAAPSTWTAARAIDYWTQQCGLFYDKVPGDCIAYASGFGHTDSYGAATTHRFYEKLVGGTTSTTVLNNRSVKTLGSAVTGTTALHDLKDGSVSVSVPKNRKLVASIGLGIRGTGRTATATWKMTDAKKAVRTISIAATSAGLITASVGGVPVSTATVTPNGDYRLTFSIERLSATAVVGKLTVHSDNGSGSGTIVHNGTATVAPYALPAVASLTSITHVSAGGSGAEMLHWGTYLSVADKHPMELPAVQKSLSATGKLFGFVSGFEGNVWALLNEYCAITRQDVSFLNAKLKITPRITGLSVPVGNFSRFSRDSERRDKYKQVAVVNKQSKAVATNDAILWRADSVFQVAAREVFETTVQTGHSILSLVQPVAVNGIWPFPYKTGAGQYVVTGADGYIIAPAWWNDNGGKVEVSLTGKEGEIAIKITAPALDTVRAPYRISEGEADRPALYVAGSGILNDPKEVHVGTGAKNAKEGFDQVFESPFIAGVMETYDTAAAMAAEYSASVADVGFELPNDFYTPSRFGQFPAGTRFTDGKRNYRITDASQTHSRVSGNAVPHTTIAEYVASYPAGSTIKDEKKRHVGRTIKQFNISPLRGTDV